MTNACPAVLHNAFFMKGSVGRLFALHIRPDIGRKATGGVLFFPPFAEEMNKSRRMVALQAKRFAALGYHVLLVDLYGTGDSEGDFADARWDIWLRDMLTAADWLRNQGVEQLTLWGLRSGALLAANAAARVSFDVAGMLLWQPVSSGQLFVNQFLRLRIAGDMMAGGEKVTTAHLRRAIDGGEVLEIAGYSVHPELIRAIDDLSIGDETAGIPAPLACFQVSATEKPNAFARRMLEVRESSRFDTTVRSLAGEQFWQTAEIAVVDELLEATADWLQEQPR